MSDNNPPRRPDMLQRALGYAAAGTPVFPCAVAGKAPLTANGFHDATTDLDRVRDWWTRTPDANIATPTGAKPRARGIDVLDVDVHPDGHGFDALARAKNAGLTDGWIRAVRTPSGGLHLYYAGTTQRNATQRNATLRGLHLDFRGLGGYILLPPSLGQTKTYSRRYEVIRTQTRPGRPLDWAAVAALLNPPTTAPPGTRPPVRAAEGIDPSPWLAAHVAKQPEGNRDNALFWAACRAAEAGVTDYQPLIDAATTAGLPEHQAARTVQSAQSIVRTTQRPASARAPAPPAVPDRSLAR